MPDAALPPNLRGKRHDDYPAGLRWIPRGWTAFAWGEPSFVVGDIGPTDMIVPRRHTAGSGWSWSPRPITSPDTWQLSRFPAGPWYAFYFAFTSIDGVHFRLGARWDDVDGYVEFPTIAIKRGVK